MGELSVISEQLSVIRRWGWWGRWGRYDEWQM